MEILDDHMNSRRGGKPSLEELNQNGYQFNFGQYWETTVEIFKKCWGWSALFFFILLMAGSLFSFIPGIKQIWQILAGVMSAGVICHSIAALRNEPVNFGDFFKVFKHIGPLLGYYLVLMLVPMIFFIPMFMDMQESGILEVFYSQSAQMELQQDPDLAEDFLFALKEAVSANLPLVLLGSLVSMIIMLFTYFVTPLIIVGKMSLGDAFKHSINLVKKNPLQIFFYSLAMGLLGLTGAIVCCIGYVGTIGLIEMSRLAMYAEVVGIDPIHEDHSDFD